MRMDTTKLARIISLGCLAALMLVQKAVGRQRFLKEPQDAVTVKGQSVFLDCHVENQVGQVQWMRDGFGLGHDRDLIGYPRYKVIGNIDQGNYRLMISNAQLEDDAVWECQVGRTTTVTGIVSRKATVTVHIQPDIPQVVGGPDIIVRDGEPFNLTCNANNGKPAANITWRSNDEILTSPVYEDIELLNNKLSNSSSKLTIVPRKLEDQGRAFRCEAMNEALTSPKWTQVYLEVQYAPEVKMTEYPRVARENGAVRFTCTATGNPDVITWRWVAGGEELKETSSTLKLSPLNRDLHGQDVMCEAKNTIGKASKSFTLNIEYGPYFNGRAEHASAEVGSTAALHCKVKGNPAPAIVWRRKGEERPLSTQSWYNITSGVTGRHFGVYTCTASVVGFPEISRDVHLMEKSAPKVIAEKEQSARYGETGVVKCIVDSVPKPSKIGWMKDGEVLDFEALERYTVRQEDPEDLPNQRHSIIEIISVQDEDYGTYNCSVENGYGHHAMEIKFTRQDVVPLPYILAGVLLGVLLIIIVAILVFVYHRRKSSASSDYTSEASEDSIEKKKEEFKPEIKVEYTNGIYGNPIDAWQQDLDPKQYRHSAEYDELKFHQGPPPKYSGNDYDYNDGYGNRGYDRDYTRDIYGTYPRNPSNRVYDNRYAVEDPYGPVYGGSDVYGTYRAPVSRPHYAASDYGPAGHTASDYGTLPPPPPASDYGIYSGPEIKPGLIPPPPPSISSRLSTNV